MDKLKPCPFCGADHAILLKPTCKETDAYDSSDRAFPLVSCPLCSAEQHGGNWDQSGDSAVSAWNTRAESAELTAANARTAYLEHLAADRLVQMTADAERIAALEEALEPFAREARHGSRIVNLTKKDLQRADAALLEKK